MIYLDNAATTYPKPECVYKAVDNIQRTLAVNAGRGSYKAAQAASQLITETREQIAVLTKADSSSNVILTPSATIALNQIIGGIEWNSMMNVYVSPFEHNAAIRPLAIAAEKYGFSIIIMPFDSATQQLDEQKLLSMFTTKRPDVVFVTHMSNVTGTILPVRTINSAAKKYGAVTVVDASQSMGMIDMNIHHLCADYIVFAGHKNLYGHLGAGGFICGNRCTLTPFLAGGTGSDSLNVKMPEAVPDRFEPASHDIIAIAALNASLKWIESIGVGNIFKHKKEITDYAAELLHHNNDLKLYLPTDMSEHVAVISLNHESYLPEELAAILDGDFDIAVRNGYHCAPYVHDLLGTRDRLGTVRISVGYFTTKSDIDALSDALNEL